MCCVSLIFLCLEWVQMLFQLCSQNLVPVENWCTTIYYCVRLLKLFWCKGKMLPTYTAITWSFLIIWITRNNRIVTNIIKCSMCLISRVGLIWKWPPQWIYIYSKLHVYISHKQVHFVCTKTFQVLLNVASSTANVNSKLLNLENGKFIVFFSFSLHKTLLQNNAIIRQAVRANLEQKHCTFYHLGT